MSKHKKILAIQIFLFGACKTGINEHQYEIFSHLNWPDLFPIHINPYDIPWVLFEIPVKH